MHSRVARSNIYLLNKLGAKVRVICPPTLLPPNIEDLGVKVFKNFEDGLNNVDIIMTLTTPNCPEAQTIPEKVADVVSLLKGVNEVKVEITWDPPWTQDNMTDAAKLELGLM